MDNYILMCSFEGTYIIEVTRDSHLKFIIYVMYIDNDNKI
jgi:hypothetical protein